MTKDNRFADYTDQEFIAILANLIQWGLIDVTSQSEQETSYQLTDKGIKHGMVLTSLLDSLGWMKAKREAQHLFDN